LKKLRQKKLLIIDVIDYPRLVLEHFLTSSGYKVFAARNGIEAVTQISTELPDLILISIRYGDCVGLSALKALKDYFRLRLDLAQRAELPVIILSAAGNSENTHDLMALGVSKVLSKPLNMQDLLNTIESSMQMENEIPRLRQKYKILILDSEVRALQLFVSILADDELYIDTVSSEREFWVKLNAPGDKTDLCIINISSVDGEIMKLLKSIRETSDNTYILTISDGDHEIALDDMKLIGIQRNFTKPIDIQIFRDTVDELLRANTEV